MDLKKILFFLAVPGMMLLAGCEAFQQAWDEALHPEEQAKAFSRNTNPSMS